MARTGDTLQVYVENPPTVQGEESLRVLRWAQAQFERIAQMHNALASGHVDVRHVEPDKPKDGTLVFADGSDWDPGYGRGIYVYDEDAADWVPCFNTYALPVDEASPGNQQYYGTDLSGTKGFYPLPVTILPIVIGFVSFFTLAALDMFPPVSATGTSRLITRLDLTNFSQVKLQVNIQESFYTGVKYILRYYTSKSVTPGDYLDIGTSEVSVSPSGTEVVEESSWINLASGAKAADRYISLLTSGGDGSTANYVGAVTAFFR